MKLKYLEKSEIDLLLDEVTEPAKKIKLLATIARLNTLYAIKKAGSGHLGSSFSAMDIVSCLYASVMKCSKNDRDKYQHDIYFSSKGHDAPGLYGVLTTLGYLDFKLIHELRRLGGLPGHPDVASTPFIFTNTGSLGMGISKAKGFIKANRVEGIQKKIYVLLGDGELQEGQFWESLHSAVNYKMDDIIAIVDHNKVQSDTLVKNVSDLGDLVLKIQAFGWEVERCDGHDIEKILNSLAKLTAKNGKPKMLIADTIKGCGVSFMEHTSMVGKYYKFHSGAPQDDDYQKAVVELEEKINLQLSSRKCQLTEIERPPVSTSKPNVKMVTKYSQIIFDQCSKNPKVICLDADLVLDTGLIPVSEKFPEQFVECGITEQDMVSQAGALALRGFTPICHSFSCFMIPRANEQIYNNISEKTKVIYMGFLSGVIPAGPGHSHQSIREISLMRSMPSMHIFSPSTEEELEFCVDYAINKTHQSSFIRIESFQVEMTGKFTQPKNFQLGCGNTFIGSKSNALISFGPVLVNECIKAANQLELKGISCSVISFPYLNNFNLDWWKEFWKQHQNIYFVENQLPDGSCGEFLLRNLAQHQFDFHGKKIHFIGMDAVPECGQPQEILKFHKLDAESLVGRMYEAGLK